MDLVEILKEHFPVNEPFLAWFNREQIGELLLKHTPCERQLDQFSIEGIANALQCKDFSPIEWTPIVIDATTNHILDGAYKLAGFINSSLSEIEFYVVLYKEP